MITMDQGRYLWRLLYKSKDGLKHAVGMLFPRGEIPRMWEASASYNERRVKSLFYVFEFLTEWAGAIREMIWDEMVNSRDLTNIFLEGTTNHSVFEQIKMEIEAFKQYPEN